MLCKDSNSKAFRIAKASLKKDFQLFRGNWIPAFAGMTAFVTCVLFLFCAAIFAQEVTVLMTNGDQAAGSLMEYANKVLKIKTQYGILEVPAKDIILIDFTSSSEKISSKAYLHVIRGKQLLELGMEDEARDEFRAAIREAPMYADAYYELGKLLEKQGQPKKAMEYLSRAMIIDPSKSGTAEQLMEMADGYFSRGELEPAAETYYRLFLNFPKAPEAEYAIYRAGLLFAGDLKNNKKALTALEKAVADFPRNQYAEKALYEIGRIYTEEGSLEDAERALVKLISSFPSGEWNDDARYILGKVYYQQKRNENAVEQLTKVMEVSSDPNLISAAQKVLDECVWIVYHVSDGLPSNNVRALAQDKQYLWIGTDSGIVRFDLRLNKMDSIVFLKGTDVQSLAADDPYLWVGTADNGIKRYDKITETWTTYTESEVLSSDKILAVSIDPDSVWFGTAGSGAYRYTKQDEKWDNYTMQDGLTSDDIVSIASTPYGVWCGTLRAGLNTFDRATGKWQGISTSHTLGNRSITSIATGGKYLWFAWYEESRNGVTRYNASTRAWDNWVIAEWEGGSQAVQGAEANMINLGSSDNETWVGAGSGVFVYNHINTSWSSSAINYPPDLSGLVPVCVLVEDESVWFATSNGLGRLNRKLVGQVEQIKQKHQ